MVDAVMCLFATVAQTNAGMWRRNGHLMPFQVGTCAPGDRDLASE